MFLCNFFLFSFSYVGVFFFLFLKIGTVRFFRKKENSNMNKKKRKIKKLLILLVPSFFFSFFVLKSWGILKNGYFYVVPFLSKCRGLALNLFGSFLCGILCHMFLFTRRQVKRTFLKITIWISNFIE